MSKTAKYIIAIVVIILVVAGVWYWGTKPSVPAGEKQTITIGITLPLSGNLAFLGNNYQQAVNLALSELSSTTNKYNYQIVFEDDKFDPATGATTANKLIGIDKVDALMSFGSPVGNVVSPIAEQNKIVHINGIASDPNVAKGNYNFVHWTPPYEEAELLVDELKKKGYKKVVVFGEKSNPGGSAIISAFKNSIKNTDVKLVGEEMISANDADFRTMILRAKSLNPDIILVLATSPKLEILAKQIKEGGIKIPLTSIETFEFTDQPALFEGLWYVNAADQTQSFIDKFTSAYNETPKLGGGNGYDSFNLLVSAFEKAGNGKTKPTSDQIASALLEIRNFDGAMGTLNMGQDHIVNTKAVVRMIKNGVPITIPE